MPLAIFRGSFQKPYLQAASKTIQISSLKSKTARQNINWPVRINKMTITLIIVSLGVAIWLTFMMMAILLPLKPGILKITEKIVCPEGTELIIQTAVHSYHRSGQRALEIYSRDNNGIVKNVGFKVISIFLMILFVMNLPISIILVTIINNSIIW